jgi:soluble lytic murein transglycosylase-like protein
MRPTLRSTAALIGLLFVTVQGAQAAQTANAAAETYATVLRTINPQLQQHQSLAFARSVIANANRTNLDPRLIMALVTVESSWRPNALSPAGARGLAQLMPGTAKRLGVDAWNPAQNLHGAANYIRTLLNRFAGRGADTLRFAIGAYNAGPQAVEKYGGIPPYSETQNYVRRVLTVWHTLNGRVGRAFATAKPPDEEAWLPSAPVSALATNPAPAGVPTQTDPSAAAADASP